MASFSLRSQRTGNYRTFSVLDILKILGDTVNDEIWLHDGDVFNLSSFKELGGGDGAGPLEQWNVEKPVITPGGYTYNLQYQPAGVLMVMLNGLVLNAPGDYSLEGRFVRFSLFFNSQDSLQFIYQY